MLALVVAVEVVVQLLQSTGHLFVICLPKTLFLQSRAMNPLQSFGLSGNPLQITVVDVAVEVVVVVVVVVDVAVVVVFVDVVAVVVVVVVEVSVAVVAVVVVDVVVTVVCEVVVVVEDVRTHERQSTGQLATRTGPMMPFMHCFRV